MVSSHLPCEGHILHLLQPSCISELLEEVLWRLGHMEDAGNGAAVGTGEVGQPVRGPVPTHQVDHHHLFLGQNDQGVG